MTDLPKLSLAQLIVKYNTVNERVLQTAEARAATWLAALEQRLQTTSVKGLVARARRLCSIDEAAVERALAADAPKPALIQMLMTVALAERARGPVSRDLELPAGTRISPPGHGVGTYVGFKSNWFAANEHVIDFGDGHNRRQVVKLPQCHANAWRVTDGVLVMPSADAAAAVESYTAQVAAERRKWQALAMKSCPCAVATTGLVASFFLPEEDRLCRVLDQSSMSMGIAMLGIEVWFCMWIGKEPSQTIEVGLLQSCTPLGVIGLVGCAFLPEHAQGVCIERALLLGLVPPAFVLTVCLVAKEPKARSENDSSS